MKYPEEINLQRQKIAQQLPRAREGGSDREQLLMVSSWGDENVKKLDSGNSFYNPRNTLQIIDLCTLSEGIYVCMYMQVWCVIISQKGYFKNMCVNMWWSIKTPTEKSKFVSCSNFQKF